MSDAEIREALERSARAVSLRPAIGQKTGRTTVRLKPGLACEVSDGRWTLTVGMGPASGGTDAGPGPGVLGRGALGSCLALGYAMWAARLGVPLDAVEVAVEADYDTRGELGVADDIPPGYTQIRYVVSIVSRAPKPMSSAWSIPPTDTALTATSSPAPTTCAVNCGSRRPPSDDGCPAPAAGAAIRVGQGRA
jgi:uncharacterized OsmC-like protein